MVTIVGSSTACYGDSVTLFVNTGLNFSYQWYDGNGIRTADTASYINTSQNGGYFCEVSAPYTCPTFSDTVNVNIKPEIISDFSIPTTSCVGEMVAINFTGTSPLNSIYNWDFVATDIDINSLDFAQDIIDDNKLDSKFSPFLSQIEFDLEKYEKEISDLDYNSKENIKIDVLKKISDMVFNNNFEAAKSEIEVLKGLYGKRDLNSFIGNSNSKIKELKEKIKSGKNSLEVDFDTSEFVYSVSQLQTYDSCPKKYLYQYVYKIPTKPRHSFDFGTTVHKVLELLLDDFGKIAEKLPHYAKFAKKFVPKCLGQGISFYLSKEDEKELLVSNLEFFKSEFGCDVEFGEDKETASPRDFVISLE